jgi:hypothetical protein
MAHDCSAVVHRLWCTGHRGCKLKVERHARVSGGKDTGVLLARRPWVQLRFLLLADFQPRGGVARRYGVYRDGQGMSARALVVLDRQGTIRFSHAYPDFFNPGVDDVLTTLEALATENERRDEPASER